MEERYDDDFGGMIVEWDADEFDEIENEAEQAREELLGMVESGSSEEVLGGVELTTNGYEMTLAEFEYGSNKSVVVYWRVGSDGEYEVFSADDGSLCQVSGVSGVANFLNGEVF